MNALDRYRRVRCDLDYAQARWERAEHRARLLATRCHPGAYRARAVADALSTAWRALLPSLERWQLAAYRHRRATRPGYAQGVPMNP